MAVGPNPVAFHLKRRVDGVVMELDVNLTPQLNMKVSPRLVAANHILELSSLELQQFVSTELDENPALEKLEQETCGICGSIMHGSICPHCLSEQKWDDNSAELSDPAIESGAMFWRGTATDEEFDPLTQVADQMSLAEYLLLELRSVLPPDDMLIAEYLVGNLDERGWLTCPVDDVAELFGVDVEEVESILRQLQSLEPVGIGARNLRECLLIQLKYLKEEQGREEPYAEEIVRRFLTELGEHKFGRIAHDLKIDHETVEHVWEYIKKDLNPYPAHLYSDDGPRGPRSPHLLPDVLISERDGGYEVEVVESKRYYLRVTPLYQRLAMDVDREPERFSEDEKKHIQQYVSRAKLFIQNINQRRQTLQRVTSCLVERQKDFLKKGVRHLEPLTRASVAAELGLHESTVSRATASKFVMLPTKQVVPFSLFFTASLSVKDVIKEIIEQEKLPLTDQDIAERLDARGIHIARRTVAKYREQLGILPSSLR
ncbi:MAG: RNA polymerase sigma-54 factor [Chloroflexota bacterium]|nr:MAG: RNA polymerase sigma-54 factor [Chloroflexota bacterium]